MSKLKGRIEVLTRSERYVSDTLYFEDECLKLTSNVYGDDYDSEAHYCINEENTKNF